MLLCFVQSGCTPAANITRNAALGGTIDRVRMELVDQDGITTLDGEWQFYWNRLLSYTDLSAESPDLPGLGAEYME